MDKVFALLHQCGALQTELVVILAHHQAPERKAKCEMVLHRCLALESRLTLDWLELDSSPSCCSTSDLACQPTLLPPGPDVTLYRFKSLYIAKIYLLFWIARTVLRRCIHQAEKFITGHSDLTWILQYAGEICRALAFCVQPSNRMSAGHAAMVATSQASKCYIDCADRSMFMWCQGVYSVLQSHGLDIAGAMGRNDRDLWTATNSQIST